MITSPNDMDVGPAATSKPNNEDVSPASEQATDGGPVSETAPPLQLEDPLPTSSSARIPKKRKAADTEPSSKQKAAAAQERAEAKEKPMSGFCWNCETQVQARIDGDQVQCTKCKQLCVELSGGETTQAADSVRSKKGKAKKKSQ
jgi:hypothetical protein